MSRLESLDKEAFQIALREAMKPELESLRAEMQTLRADIRDLGARVGDLEHQVSRLQGTLEGMMRAYEADPGRMFAGFLRDAEPDIFYGASRPDDTRRKEQLS